MVLDFLLHNRDHKQPFQYREIISIKKNPDLDLRLSTNSSLKE
jgi:hypothetical protein